MQRNDFVIKGIDDIDFDLKDGNILSGEAKLAFKQWKIDPNDHLLISGYLQPTITKSNASVSTIPTVIISIIASYYFKNYSKSDLKKLIEDQKLLNKQKKQDNKETRQRWYLWILLVIALYYTIVCPSIAIHYGDKLSDLRKNSDCDIFSGFDTVGDALYAFGIITVVLDVLIPIVGLDRCSEDCVLFGCSIFALLSYIIWIVFYGFIFNAYELLNEGNGADYGEDCDDYFKIIRILTNVFAVNVAIPPLFCCILCIKECQLYT